MRFDSPVGTQAERDSDKIWPGSWVDANPYGSYYQLGSSYSYHTGADLNLNKPAYDSDRAAPIHSIGDGLVEYAALNSVWGANNGLVVIRHDRPDGISVWSRYGHVEQIVVGKGDRVQRGRQLGIIGNAGGRYPYHLHFDIALKNLGAAPGDWPGADLARLRRDYIDPAAWLQSNRSIGGGVSTPPKATIIRPPYDKTYHVCVGGTQSQRDAVYLMASSLGHSATCSGDDGALNLLQVTSEGVSEFKSRTIFIYGVPDSERSEFDKFVNGAHPGTGPLAVYYRDWPGGAARPLVTFTATPNYISPGELVTLYWTASGDVAQIASAKAWPADAPDRAVTVSAFPFQYEIWPNKSKTWVTRVTYTDGATKDYEATIVAAWPAVTFTASPASITAGMSSQLTWNAAKASSATLNGAAVATSQSTTVFPTATTTYTLVAKYVDGASQSRSATVAVTPAPVTAKHHLGVHFNTAAHVARDLANRGCRAFLFLNNKDMAVETAMNFPDAIVVYRRYLDRTKLNGTQLAARLLEGPNHPRVLLQGFNEQDEWPYSTPTELLNRCQFELEAARIIKANGYQMIAGNFSMGTPDITKDDICQVLRNEFAPAYNSGLIWLGQHIYSPNPAHSPDEWFELRYRWYFTKCGFSPAIRHIIGTEAGLDQGGVGGYPAHNVTPDQFRMMQQRFLAAWAQPMYVNGVAYADPCIASTIYQFGDTDRWAGYCIGTTATDRYMPTLAEFWR